MKGKVLEKGAVEALKYDSPQYVEEHGQALLWLEDLNNKGVLTDFANQFQAKTGKGKPIEHAAEKLAKKNPLLGALLGEVNRQAAANPATQGLVKQTPEQTEWAIALGNYKGSIDDCKAGKECKMSKYARWAVRGSLRNLNELVVNMSASYLAMIEPFVQEKMKVFEKASATPQQGQGQGQGPAPQPSEAH